MVDLNDLQASSSSDYTEQPAPVNCRDELVAFLALDTDASLHTVPWTAYYAAFSIDLCMTSDWLDWAIQPREDGDNKLDHSSAFVGSKKPRYTHFDNGISVSGRLRCVAT